MNLKKQSLQKKDSKKKLILSKMILMNFHLLKRKKRSLPLNILNYPQKLLKKLNII